MVTFDNDKTYIEFGRFVKQGRKTKGLRQKDVAEMVELTQAYYSYIERGERQITLPLALNICSALGLNFNDFVTHISRAKPRLIHNANENSSPPVDK